MLTPVMAGKRVRCSSLTRDVMARGLVMSALRAASWTKAGATVDTHT
jgi:hypothetical protein